MKTDVVREPATAISGMQVTRQIQLSDKDTMAFELVVDATTEESVLHDMMDMIARVTERQRAVHELPRREQALQIAKAQIKMMAEEEARLQASHIAEHAASGRRGEYKPSAQEKQAIDNSRQSRAKFLADVPVIEEEIARLRALIDRISTDPEPGLLAAD